MNKKGIKISFINDKICLVRTTACIVIFEASWRNLRWFCILRSSSRHIPPMDSLQRSCSLLLSCRSNNVYRAIHSWIFALKARFRTLFVAKIRFHFRIEARGDRTGTWWRSNSIATFCLGISSLLQIKLRTSLSLLVWQKELRSFWNWIKSSTVYLLTRAISTLTSICSVGWFICTHSLSWISLSSTLSR